MHSPLADFRCRVMGNEMRILELTYRECVEMLTHLKHGRLACSRDDQPYVVPIYFAYHERHLYSFATRGQKIDWMRTNPRVCVEADEIINREDWMSVIVQGRYEELPDTLEWKPERERAYELLQQEAMWWEPAYVSTAHLDTADELIPIFYRIHIDHVTGRRARPDRVDRATPPEGATAPQSESRLKRLLRRLWFVGPDRTSY
jgi:nitroimidazol reductase NimA-like FMN-containing flavoprotein (pyridoxamine 5'-phosphate oxidase superfamily)